MGGKSLLFEMEEPKRVARIFAFLVAWCTVTVFVIVGLVRGFSLLVLVLRALLLGVVVFYVVYFYLSWFLTPREVNSQKEE